MKNIIVEGISGVGKTTLISELKKENSAIEIIPDLEYETPIKQILLDLVNKDPLMKSNKDFKTSIYESLLLAANQYYIQEKIKNNDKINIFDRDFISVLAYQKILIKEEYKNWKKIFEAYKNMLLVDNKQIDLIVYINAPLELCIERVEKRDGRCYTKKDIDLIKEIKKSMEEEIKEFENNGGEILILNGEETIGDNKEKILKKVGLI